MSKKKMDTQSALSVVMIGALSTFTTEAQAVDCVPDVSNTNSYDLSGQLCDIQINSSHGDLVFNIQDSTTNIRQDATLGVDAGKNNKNSVFARGGRDTTVEAKNLNVNASAKAETRLFIGSMDAPAIVKLDGNFTANGLTGDNTVIALLGTNPLLEVNQSASISGAFNTGLILNGIMPNVTIKENLIIDQQSEVVTSSTPTLAGIHLGSGNLNVEQNINIKTALNQGNAQAILAGSGAIKTPVLNINATAKAHGITVERSRYDGLLIEAGAPITLATTPVLDTAKLSFGSNTTIETQEGKALLIKDESGSPVFKTMNITNEGTLQSHKSDAISTSVDSSMGGVSPETINISIENRGNILAGDLNQYAIKLGTGDNQLVSTGGKIRGKVNLGYSPTDKVAEVRLSGTDLNEMSALLSASNSRLILDQSLTASSHHHLTSLVAGNTHLDGQWQSIEVGVGTVKQGHLSSDGNKAILRIGSDLDSTKSQKEGNIDLFSSSTTEAPQLLIGKNGVLALDKDVKLGVIRLNHYIGSGSMWSEQGKVINKGIIDLTLGSDEADDRLLISKGTVFDENIHVYESQKDEGKIIVNSEWYRGNKQKNDKVEIVGNLGANSVTKVEVKGGVIKGDFNPDDENGGKVKLFSGEFENPVIEVEGVAFDGNFIGSARINSTAYEAQLMRKRADYQDNNDLMHGKTIEELDHNPADAPKEGERFGATDLSHRFTWVTAVLKPSTPMAPIYVAGATAYLNMERNTQEALFDQISTFHERRGSSFVPHGQDQLTWGRLHVRTHEEKGQDRFDYEQKTQQLSLGHDVVHDGGITGAFVNIGKSNVDYFDAYRAESGRVVEDKFTGKGKSSQIGVGVSHTLPFDDFKGYVDISAQASYLRNEYQARSGVSGKNKGKALSLSAEAGYAFQVAEKVAIEPQVQVIYQNVKLKDFQDSSGLDIRYRDGDQVRSRVGARVIFGEQSALGAPKVYAKANVWHNGKASSKVSLDTTELSEKHSKTWLDTGIGASVPLGANGLLYGDAHYERNLGGEKRKGFGLNVGIRYDW
ncbi:MAG: autotransporter outer membrane beta-barrel domain-containing protein [Cardiobacteriaceae bacterium]|nr:autotransporter outer membrane beta-barrel domain-containing protein [Cardiobacteriaceae bacterium]